MNKLILAVTLVVVFVSQAAQAQHQEKSFIYISGGLSFPLGEFKLKDFTDDRAGFAKTGGFLDLAYGYKFSKYVGVMALLKGRVYGVDFADYALPIGTGMGIQIESTTWRSGAVMTGLFVSLPLDRKSLFEVGVKGLAGIQRTYSPALNIRATGTVIASGKQESVSASSFSYLAGVDLKYRLTRTLQLLVSADLNSSTPKFDSITGSGGGTNIEGAAEQVTSSLDVGLGLAIKL